MPIRAASPWDACAVFLESCALPRLMFMLVGALLHVHGCNLCFHFLQLSGLHAASRTLPNVIHLMVM